MNLLTDNINETRKAITITVPRQVVEDEEAKLLKEATKKVNLPGFRPGKVPVDMLKTKFAEALDAELSEKVIMAAHKYLIDNAGLNIYSIIEIKVQGDKVVPNEDAVLNFLVDIKPDFELPTYKGIPVQVPAVEVSEQEIEQTIKTILKEYSEFNVTDNAAQKGDYVKLSYEGKINGQPIAEIVPRRTIYGTQKSTWEEAGAENVPGVPAIIEGIIGMKAGDNKTVTMHFPQDFEVAELAGKEAVYDLSVEEVRNLVLPEMDETLFKKLGVENIDQLRENIKEYIAKNKNNESQNLVIQKVIEYLINSVATSVPESAIKDEEDALIRVYMKRMIEAGLNQAQIDSKEDEIIENAKNEALGRAKLHMILSSIAEKEKIEITDNDLNTRVMIEAHNLKIKPQKFVNDLKKDQKAINDFRQTTLFNKVLDFLRRLAKVEFMKF